MSEELSNKEIKSEKTGCNCKCCECIRKFVILTSSIFVGTTLAILVSASLLKPPMPPCQPMMNPPIPMMQPMPPNMRGEHFKPQKDFKDFHHGQDFNNVPNEVSKTR